MLRGPARRWWINGKRVPGLRKMGWWTNGGGAWTMGKAVLHDYPNTFEQSCLVSDGPHIAGLTEVLLWSGTKIGKVYPNAARSI